MTQPSAAAQGSTNDPTTASIEALLLLAASLPDACLRNLLDAYGDPVSATEAGAHAWQHHGAKPEHIKRFGEPICKQRADHALHWLNAHKQHHLIAWHDAHYPSLLRQIGSPPPLLFVAGNPDWLWYPQIAIVGSRNATTGGIANTKTFAQAFCRAGLVVTSGLADGIDAAAHNAALDAQQPTIAVIGTGSDIIYPSKNQALAARIRDYGTIVSEFFPGTPAKREHFPRRNRIIAGLSLGTLVVEAAQRSGALITARLASEAGREIFALPGSIHNPMARGCHRLIREGAMLVETTQEITDALQPMAEELRQRIMRQIDSKQSSSDSDASKGDTTSNHTHTLDADAAQLLDALGHDPTDMDALVARTGLSVAELSSLLLRLELDGLVASEHGQYSRITQA